VKNYRKFYNKSFQLTANASAEFKRYVWSIKNNWGQCVIYGMGISQERNANYLNMFEEVEPELLFKIRQVASKSLALGSEKFISEIELLTNRRVSSRKAGRPRKRKNEN